MREFDPGRLLYESTKPGSSRNGPRVLKPFELLDGLAALMPPPRLHRHCYFGAFASAIMGAVVAWLYCYVLIFAAVIRARGSAGL